MKLGLLSNVNLPRNINWSLLSDPLHAALAGAGDTALLSPPPLGAAWRAARGCDALFAMHGSARSEWPLMALNALAGARRRAVFYVDPWPYQLRRIAWVNAALRVDLAFIPYAEAMAQLAAQGGRTRYLHLPFAADTQAFAPGDAPRDIDILWMGRRHEPLHRAILAHAGAQGLTYHYRETTGFIADPLELGRLAARARYFVVTPPDLDGPGRSGGFSPLVMRYLEGLAAGCRLLGVLPRSGEFQAILPRAALLEVAADGSDVAARLIADQGDAAGWAVSAEAGAIVRRDHGWEARARTIWQELRA